MTTERKPDVPLTLELKQMLYETYFQMVYRLSLYLTKEQQAAEDVTHETFIKVFENFSQLRSLSKIEAWIKTITVNNARKHFNEQKRVLLIEPEGLRTQQTTENELLEEKELGDYLKKELQKLPPEFLEVLILKYYSDLEISEIATSLNLPEGTVKSRLARGRKKLKALIKQSNWLLSTEKGNIL